MTPTVTPPRFPHGRVFMTASVVELVREGKLNVLECLERHLSGDWGDVSDSQKDMNEHSLMYGGTLVSRYDVSASLQIVLLTKHDRSLTKVMLVSEFLDDDYD